MSSKPVTFYNPSAPQDFFNFFFVFMVFCTFVMSLLAEGDKESRDQGGNMEVDIG